MLDGREFDEPGFDARVLDEREFCGRALLFCTWVELFCERVTGARLALFCERANVLLRWLLCDSVAWFELRVVLLERAKSELRLLLDAIAPWPENSPGRAVAVTDGRP